MATEEVLDPEGDTVVQGVRWGIIGCGDVVERKSGAAFQSVERSELVAVMRRSGNLAEAFANIQPW